MPKRSLAETVDFLHKRLRTQPTFSFLGQTFKTTRHGIYFTDAQYEIVLADQSDFEDELYKLIERAVKQSMDDLKVQKLSPTHIGMKIKSESLNDDICTTWRDLNVHNPGELVAKFSKLQQSASRGNLLGRPFTLCVNIRYDNSGGIDDRIQTIKLTHNGLLPNISNGDCLFKAVIMGRLSQISSADGHNMRLAKQISVADIKKNAITYQRHIQPLIRFCCKLGNIYPLRINTRIIERYLNNTFPQQAPHRLIVVEDASISTPWLYPSKEREYPDIPKSNIVILLKDGHFTTVWNHNKFFNAREICYDCRISIDRWSRHSITCKVKCKHCGQQRQSSCPEETTHISCIKCFTTFKNVSCFQAHLTRTCSQIKTCLDCCCRYKTSKEHKCGHKYCPKCHMIHSTKRGCFLSKLASPKQSPKYQLVSFDYETRQEEGPDGIQHVVNFAAVRFACHACMDSGDWEERKCSKCHNHLKYWSEAEGVLNPVKSMLEFIIENTGKKTTTICMGHYAGRFDIQLTMKEIYASNPNKKLKIICSGNKIFRLIMQGGSEFKEIRFIDSYNFIPMALDKVGDALSLPDAIRQKGKGYFPHGYNRIENYIKSRITLPPKKDYYADGMMAAKHDKFVKWWDDNKNTSFDLPEQLRIYGQNDVDLLLHALVKYRQLVREITQNKFDDVYYRCITLAASTMRDIRMNHLKEETIAVIPRRGYTRQETQSKFALKFLKWYSSGTGINVQHRDNGGEKKIHLSNGKRVRVDGYIERGKKIIEVHGCYWHGCPLHNWKRDEPLPDCKTPQRLYQDSEQRIKALEADGYNVQVFWECKIKTMLKEDAKMKEFFDNCPDTNPIQFDEAFYGGRVNTHSLYANAKDGKIFYTDIQSLYPYILFYSEFPVGIPKHKFINEPQIWNSPQDVPEKGIWKVFVVPPKKLNLPVLPLKVKGSLMFPLCSKCANSNASNRWCKHIKCKHSDEERGFMSTSTHIELQKALEKGYQVRHVYDAYVWDEWSTELFKDYIKKNLKVKIEASGVPNNMSDSDKVKYANEIFQKYGFNIDTTNWKLNEGLRTIAKLRLNSSWGKFAQRNDLSKVAICRSEEEVDEIFDMPGVKIKDCYMISDNVIFIKYKLKDEYVVESDFSNVVVALYTTSAARLRLYEFMDQCVQNGGTVLYTDTDSIIMQSPNNQMPVTTGNFLGDMEIEKANYDILEYVSGGSKQYGLHLRHCVTGEESYELKLRGITLNHQTDAIINYHQFSRLVKDNSEIRQHLTAEYTRLQPKLHGGVKTIIQQKKYQPVINKGIFSQDPNDTKIYPYGFDFTI